MQRLRSLALCLVALTPAVAAAQEPITIKPRTTLQGDKIILSVAFSPDSKTFAVGEYYSKIVRLYDAAADKETAKLTTDSTTPFVLAFSTDGKTLASAGLDEGVVRWDLGNSKRLGDLKGMRGVAYSADGKLVAAAAAGVQGKTTLWDAATDQELHQVSGGGRAVAFSPDGKLVATAGDNVTHKVQVFDTGTGKERAALNGHKDEVPTLAFSPDGATLASADFSGVVKLWDVATWKERASFQAHTDRIYAVVFSPDRKTLATCGWEGTIKLWDVATHKEVAVLSGHKGRVWSIAISPDGKLLVSGGADRTVRVWELPER